MPVREKRIDYIEFPMNDIDAAKQFYGAVFGWEFVDYGPEYASFTVESAGIAGGFFLSHGPVAQWPLVVIHVDDIAAMEAAVTSAGGRIVKPTFPFPGGRRFHFTDPSGNELSVWHDDGDEADAAGDDEDASAIANPTSTFGGTDEEVA